MTHKITQAITVFATIAIMGSCKEKTPTPPAKPSIYERLGGTALVSDPDNAGQTVEAGRLSFRKVVNTTIGLIVADITAGNTGNFSAHFAPLLAETGTTQSTSIATLSDNLTDFFASNTGGTNAVNKYNGLDMVSAHDPAKHPRMGDKVNKADYDKFEGFVAQALNTHGVATGTELFNDLVAVLESVRTPITQK
jgi:hypothetical protein